MRSNARGIVEQAQAFAYVAASALAASVVAPYAPLEDLAMIHLLGVVLISMRYSVQASVIACFVSIISFDFFFMAPRFDLKWTDTPSGLTFVAMLVVAYMISTLQQRLIEQERAARATAFRAEALYELNVELSSLSELHEISAVSARHLERLFETTVSILLRTASGKLERRRDDQDLELAERALSRHELTSGRTPAGTAMWAPLVGVHATLGVVGVTVADGSGKGPNLGFLLSACANQIATAMERVQLAQAIRRSQLQAEAERLRSSLLSAVTHDVKTPLASIIAAGTTLINRKSELASNEVEHLLSTIVGEGERLSRLIQNLLSLSRLESPSIELRRSHESMDEIIATAVQRVETNLGSRRVKMVLARDLPLVFAEPVLLEQVLINLLENAARYAGVNADIAVHAAADRDEITVQITDDGPGISEDERGKVFEKFYRGAHSGKSDGGVGLGLTICRAIIHAHGGRISLREHKGGGTLVEFTVPVARALAVDESATEGMVSA